MTQTGWAQNPSIAILVGIAGLALVVLREWLRENRTFIRATNALFLLGIVLLAAGTLKRMVADLREPPVKPKVV